MNSSALQMPETPRDQRGAWFVMALRGDSDAATRLYEACVPAVRGWLRGRVGESVAEECAHEAMVMAFRRGEHFRPGTCFESWVRTMAWRMALNALRTDLRRKTRETAFFEQNDPQDDFRDEAVWAVLDRCVAELPGEQRQLIRLRFQTFITRKYDTLDFSCHVSKFKENHFPLIATDRHPPLNHCLASLVT